MLAAFDRCSISQFPGRSRAFIFAFLFHLLLNMTMSRASLLISDKYHLIELFSRSEEDESNILSSLRDRVLPLPPPLHPIKRKVLHRDVCAAYALTITP